MTTPQPRILITAGPTYEPIDAVRFVGNRSSGRLGSALADAAARRGWNATLLLGPNALRPEDPRVLTHPFRSTDDLDQALRAHLPHADLLVMAAAVADYRPVATPELLAGKRRRSAGSLTLELEPTPDLLAACAARRRPGQILCGFALEPEDGLLDAARDKLARKGIDCLVANPLETMDAPDIRATLIRSDGSAESTPGPLPKPAFADWLLDRLAPLLPHPTPAPTR